MTAVWVVIALLAVGTAVIKATGPVLLGKGEMPAPLAGAISLLLPALLAALILEQTVGAHGRLTLDARVVGVGIAAVALALRLHLVLVVVLAAAGTALVRLAG